MAGISLRLITSLAPSEIALEYFNLTGSHPLSASENADAIHGTLQCVLLQIRVILAPY
jgi:hypothetical protein